MGNTSGLRKPDGRTITNTWYIYVRMELKKL